MSQQGKRKTKSFWTFIHSKKSKVFLRTSSEFSTLV